MRRISAATAVILLAAALMARADASRPADASAQGRLDRFARRLKVHYQVVDNHPLLCLAGGCFVSDILLEDTQWDLPAGWSIYFNIEASITSVESDRLTVRHINGGLYQIVPQPGFADKPGGAALTIRIKGGEPQLSRYCIMPNWYVAAAGSAPRIIDSTRPAIDRDTGLEQLPFAEPFEDEDRLAAQSFWDQTGWPTAASLYEAYEAADGATDNDLAAEVLPTPLFERRAAAGGSLDLARGLRIGDGQVRRLRLRAAFEDLRRAGLRRSESGWPVAAVVAPAANGRAGAYSLSIGAHGIDIRAQDADGVSYALYTLLQLTGRDRRAPRIMVRDAPRFAYRGLMIDVARNFHGKQELFKLLRQMSMYKLNRLHLHLADDQAWRLEIAGLPELTRVGARRCHDPAESRCLMPQLGSGPDQTGPGLYYSSADYIDIVRAAQARHIVVIPSFDMPGHSRAAIVAMEARARRLDAAGDRQGASRFRLQDPDDHPDYQSVQEFSDNTINVCMESSYAFVAKVVTRIKRLHAAAGQPLARYHIGGDETPGAWEHSPACARMSAATGVPVRELGGLFLQRVAGMLHAQGIVPAVWSDGISGIDRKDLPAELQSNAWESLYRDGAKIAHHQANEGIEVVISTPEVTYFDSPYSSDPEEPGNAWASRDTDTRKVFDFMPENLPADAGQWTDLKGRHGSGVDEEPLRPDVAYYGIQAQLWSEMVRGDRQVEYMLFPRLLALAERAWHRADWELPYDPAVRRYDHVAEPLDTGLVPRRSDDWSRFANLLGRRELARLDAEGIRYRVPPPGAELIGNTLRANTPFPGLPIEYRRNGGAWMPLGDAVPIGGTLEVRTLSADRKRASRITQVTGEADAAKPGDR